MPVKVPHTLTPSRSDIPSPAIWFDALCCNPVLRAVRPRPQTIAWSQRFLRGCLCGGALPGLKEIMDRLTFHHAMDQVFRQDGLKLLHIETQPKICAENQCFKSPTPNSPISNLRN